MLFLKKILFAFVFFITCNVHANQFDSINPNSLNIAKTNEIANFLNNKIIEGIYSDNSKFVEIFQKNGKEMYQMK